MAGGRKQDRSTQRGAHFTDDYFVFPHIFWMVLITIGFYLLFISTFCPANASLLTPWPLSDFISYMGHSQRHICIGLCMFAVVAHCVEAAYAGKVCQDKCLTLAATMKWSFMTFLFGFASLGPLLHYGRQKEAKLH